MATTEVMEITGVIEEAVTSVGVAVVEEADLEVDPVVVVANEVIEVATTDHKTNNGPNSKLTRDMTTVWNKQMAENRSRRYA